MNSLLKAAQDAVAELTNSVQFGADFVRLKLQFATIHQDGFIFSTRFGADFFAEVSNRLQTGELIKAEPGQKLGEYDKNFNNWLTAKTAKLQPQKLNRDHAQ